MFTKMRHLIGVASLGGMVAASPVIAPKSLREFHRMTNNRDNVRQGVPLDRALVKRWAELYSYVIAEFHKDHRDATASIEGDYSTLDIRIHRLQGTEHDWVARRLTVQELRTADLRALATRLYALSKEPPAAPR